jgi:hypothetical protein
MELNAPMIIECWRICISRESIFLNGMQHIATWSLERQQIVGKPQITTFLCWKSEYKTDSDLFEHHFFYIAHITVII